MSRTASVARAGICGEPLLAADLGGTHLRSAVVTPDGVVGCHRRIRTPVGAPGTRPVIEFIRSCLAEASIAGVVAGLPGRVDYEHGRLDRAENLPPGWARELNETDLSEAVGVPVTIANDAGQLGLDPPVTALMVYNSNPVVVCPEQDKVIAGLSREDLFTVVSDHFLTDTAARAGGTEEDDWP